MWAPNLAVRADFLVFPAFPFWLSIFFKKNFFCFFWSFYLLLGAEWGRAGVDRKICVWLGSSSAFLRNAVQDRHLVLARPPRAFH